MVSRVRIRSRLGLDRVMLVGQGKIPTRIGLVRLVWFGLVD